MPNAPVEPPVTPLIDDRYWFARSKELVDRGSSAYSDAAAKLQTTLVWLWGLYTAGAAVGLALAKAKFSVSTTAWTALPSVLMPIAYWTTTWVQMPAHADFDARAPAAIREAVNASVSEKRFRLRWAQLASFLATASVAASLFAAAFSKPVTDYRLHVLRCAGDLVSVVGSGPNSIEIGILVPSSVPSNARTAVVKSDADGVFAAAVRLPDSNKGHTATASWTSADGFQQLSGAVPDDASPGCTSGAPDEHASVPKLTDMGVVGTFAVGHDSSDDPAVLERICTIRKRLAAERADIAGAFVIGSADRQPLHGRLQEQFDSNTGLAQARAQWVAARLTQADTGCAPADGQDAGQVSVVALTNGPHATQRLNGVDYTAEYANDRSVHVWAIKSEHSGASEKVR